ncbi:hypothetical protein RESH_03455 [Rhodopirellula europaea SH398]|uniref:Uncharacterized protein n=1 Tax=Rhodopirellula europaea SH398 TaxID=1263868 RepID=M5S374_9BACT|nr:hypothetical protein RESH_03455 [Rhodopirellula europaea SH398]
MSTEVKDAAPDPRRSSIQQTITAVDGSSINALPSNEPAAMGQMRTTPRQRVYS